MANEGSTKPTYEELEFELRYIADSPTEGHGGFHPRVVKAAQDALAELLRVRGLLQRIEGEFREDSPTEVWRVVKEIFGAESAEIGKLDSADKKEFLYNPPRVKSVEMGKVNRVEEIWKACRAAAQEVLWSNISPEELDRAHVQEDITDQARVILKHVQPWLAVSAETGGEKADEVCPICGTLDYGCCPAIAIGDPWVCLKHPIRRRDFGEELADMVKAVPNFLRTSQNQTVSSGVEGAHEGTTADESGSREPEKHQHVCEFYVAHYGQHQCACGLRTTMHMSVDDKCAREPEKLNNAQPEEKL